MNTTTIHSITKHLLYTSMLGITMMNPLPALPQNAQAASLDIQQQTPIVWEAPSPTDRSLALEREMLKRDASLRALSVIPKATISPTPNHFPNDPSGSLKAPTSIERGPLNLCSVDFSDFQALDRMDDNSFPADMYAKRTFARAPWWIQNCGNDSLIWIYPHEYNHFHLNYEDPHITTCPGTFDFAIVHMDGTCEDFDPRDEPRSLANHDPTKATSLSVVTNGVGQQPFGLHSLRVKSATSIRLCYKPVQWENAWQSYDPDGVTTPGIWFCVENLTTGHWNLSAWTNNVTKVTISAYDSGIYEIDDLVFSMSSTDEAPDPTVRPEFEGGPDGFGIDRPSGDPLTSSGFVTR